MHLATFPPISFLVFTTIISPLYTVYAHAYDPVSPEPSPLVPRYPRPPEGHPNPNAAGPPQLPSTELHCVHGQIGVRQERRMVRCPEHVECRGSRLRPLERNLVDGAPCTLATFRACMKSCACRLREDSKMDEGPPLGIVHPRPHR